MQVVLTDVDVLQVEVHVLLVVHVVVQVIDVTDCVIEV